MPSPSALPLSWPLVRRRSTATWWRIASFALACSTALPAADGPGDMTATGAADRTRPVPREPVRGGTSDLANFSGNVSARPELLPVYFPAPVPVLGAELPPPPTVRDPRWSELAPFANELFFAPLSTRLAQGDLNRRARERLEAWKTARATLLDELRRQLAAPAESPEADAAARAALAARQEPRLQELAARAEELRRDFSRGSFSGSDWNEHRNWRLGDPADKRTARELLFDELSVLRAAIYYQEGLSAPQRQLLREIVLELAQTLGDAEATAVGDSFEPAQIAFYFPHGARVRVPAETPPGVLAALAEFTAQKTALKRELREMLFSRDRDSAGRRERALQELAAAQAPRFVAVEAQADTLRAGLAAAVAPPASVMQTDWPPALTARIAAYLREKAELQKAAQLEARPAAASDPRNRGKKPPTAAESRAALAEFEERNRVRVAALTAEARQIREEVARLAAARADGTGGKPVEALLADFMAAFKQQQQQAIYRDYHAALFQPGLSAAQRQLLFDAAVSALELTGAKDWQAVPE